MTIFFRKLSKLATGPCLAVWIIFAPAPGIAADLEAQTQAVFLYKLFNHITWPKHKQPQPGQPKIFCFWGKSEILEVVRMIEEKTKDDINIVQLSALDDIKACHVLFISDPNEHLPKNLDISIRDNVLTATNSNDFAQMDIMVILSFKGDKLKTTINRSAILQAGLKLSSKLLRLADDIR
jgi:hypothetical protein